MNSVATPSASPLHRVGRALRRWLQMPRAESEYVAPVLFFVARKHDLAYLQVPKAACTSLRAAICLLNHPELSPELVTSDEWVHRNRKMNDILGRVRGTREALSLYLCAPPLREVRFLLPKQDRATGLTGGGEDDLEAGLHRGNVHRCSAGGDRGHARSSTRPPPYPAGGPGLSRRPSLVEFIGRVERLAEDIKVVENRVGISLNLPHLNRAAGGGVDRARELLTEAARARLQRIYQRDFERFAYEP